MVIQLWSLAWDLIGSKSSFCLVGKEDVLENTYQRQQYFCCVSTLRWLWWCVDLKCQHLCSPDERRELGGGESGESGRT